MLLIFFLLGHFSDIGRCNDWFLHFWLDGIDRDAVVQGEGMPLEVGVIYIYDHLQVFISVCVSL
jgi:hypothetical protein